MDNYELVKADLGTGKADIKSSYIGTFGKVSLVKQLKTGRLMVWKQVNYGQMKDKEK